MNTFIRCSRAPEKRQTTPTWVASPVENHWPRRTTCVNWHRCGNANKCCSMAIP